MNNHPARPGIVAIYKFNFPIDSITSLHNIVDAENTALQVVQECTQYGEVELHFTSSSIRFGSIELEVAVWVGSLVSFLKLYPSFKKGFNEIVADVQKVLDKIHLNNIKIEKTPLGKVPKVELVSHVNNVPKLAEVFLLGLDLYQLYTVSQNKNSAIQNTQYILSKYSSLYSEYAINLNEAFISLIQADLNGLGIAEKSLVQFGDIYPLSFQLGVQIMNLSNALKHCYNSRHYEIIDQVLKQVEDDANKMNISNDFVSHVKSSRQRMDSLMMLTPEEFEKKNQDLLNENLALLLKELNRLDPSIN